MDREKVIKALSICVPETQDDSKLECSDCPYGDVCNPNDIVGITLPLIWDIRTLLKEQENDLRIMFNRCQATAKLLTSGSSCNGCTMREKCERLTK